YRGDPGPGRRAGHLTLSFAEDWRGSSRSADRRHCPDPPGQLVSAGAGWFAVSGRLVEPRGELSRPGAVLLRDRRPDVWRGPVDDRVYSGTGRESMALDHARGVHRRAGAR